MQTVIKELKQRLTWLTIVAGQRRSSPKKKEAKKLIPEYQKAINILEGSLAMPLNHAGSLPIPVFGDSSPDNDAMENTAKCIKGVVTSRADYDKAIKSFICYKPVKVARELKDDFYRALSKQLMDDGIERWQAVSTPFKKYWRFVRNNLDL